MDNFNATNKILDNLKKKYKYMDSIFTFTKDMQKAFELEDAVSFEKILDMRGDAMVLVSKLDEENLEIIQKLPVALADKMRAILFPKKYGNGNVDALKLANPLETNIYDTNKQIGQLLVKIVKLDTEISAKVNGNAKNGIDIRG
ncbi:MAG: hypothetical protein ACTTH0_00500 [Eubacteriales bacterium]